MLSVCIKPIALINLACAFGTSDPTPVHLLCFGDL